jgi:hypothetical protein
MSNSTLSKIGQIGFDDHRFRGKSVLNHLIDHEDAISLIWLGLTGNSLLAEERQVLAWMAGAATAADARVWPLKITRLLSSYGNAYAGFYGGQLATPSDRIGAGSLHKSTQSLKELMNAIEMHGGQITAETLKPILAKYLEKNPRINGFGVPFRKTDERLDAFLKRIQGHPFADRPYWKLACLLMKQMREFKGVEPNMSLAVAAVLLDLGIPAHQASFVCSLLIMSPAFSSHALEGSLHEFHHWREISAQQIRYVGKPMRKLISKSR